MTNILNGIYNFLDFLNENWTMLTAILVLAISIAKKIVDFSKKSKAEQLAIAKAQISETMLKWVTEAEKNYLQWVSAGAIKRSQVIDQIFKEYPILSKVADQEEIIEWLDDTIDEALKAMRKIFEENKNTANVE